MDARYTLRKTEVLEECQVAPEIFEQVMPLCRKTEGIYLVIERVESSGRGDRGRVTL